MAALMDCLQHNTSLTNLELDTPTGGGATAKTMLELVLAKNRQVQHYQNIASELRKRNKALIRELSTYQQNK